MPGGIETVEVEAMKLDHEARLQEMSKPSTRRPPIENLVFEGGGAKGVVYVGAIQALEDNHVLGEVKRVGGSSAGSITAMLLAVGYTSDEIKYILTEVLDMKSLMDQRCQWDPKVKGPKGIPVGISTIINVFKHKGAFKGDKFREVMKELLADKLKNRIEAYLKEKYADLFEEERAFSKKNNFDEVMTQRRIDVFLKEKYEQYLDQHEIDELGAVTFGQLKKINDEFKDYPKIKGFDLYVTGTRLTDGSLKVFSHETDANMPVFEGVAISSCFPGGFEPVYYKGHYYCDGGVADNAPLKMFDKPAYLSHGINEAGVNPCTLGFLVDSKKEIEQRWGVDDGDLNQHVSFKNYLGQIMHAYHSRLEELKAKHDMNLIQIYDVDIDTMQLDIPTEKVLRAIKEGADTTQAYLDLYHGPDVVYEAQVFEDYYQKYYVMSEVQLQDAYQNVGHQLAQLQATLDIFKEQVALSDVLKEVQLAINDAGSMSPEAFKFVDSQREDFEAHLQAQEHLKAVELEIEAIEHDNQMTEAALSRERSRWATITGIYDSMTRREDFQALNSTSEIFPYAEELEAVRLNIDRLEKRQQKINEKVEGKILERNQIVAQLEHIEESRNEELHALFLQEKTLSMIIKDDLIQSLTDMRDQYHEHLDVLIDVMEAKGLRPQDPRMDPEEPFTNVQRTIPVDYGVDDSQRSQVSEDFNMAMSLLELEERLVTGNWGDYIDFNTRENVRYNNQHVQVTENGTVGLHHTGFEVKHVLAQPENEVVDHKTRTITKVHPIEAQLLVPEDSTLENPTVQVKELFMIFQDPLRDANHLKYRQLSEHYKNREDNFEKNKEKFLKHLKWQIRHIKSLKLKPEDAKINLTISGTGMGAHDAQLMLQALVAAMRDPLQAGDFDFSQIELSVQNLPRVSAQKAQQFNEDVEALKANENAVRLKVFQMNHLAAKNRFTSACYFGEESLFTHVKPENIDMTLQARTKSNQYYKHWHHRADEPNPSIFQKLNKKHTFFGGAWHRTYLDAKHLGRNFRQWLTYSFAPTIGKIIFSPVKLSFYIIKGLVKIPYWSVKGLVRSVRSRIWKMPSRFNRKRDWQQSISANLASRNQELDLRPAPQEHIKDKAEDLLARSGASTRLMKNQRPPIENVVLSGNGINNVAIVGALKSFEKNGQLEGVKRFAGGSFGGVIGALMAIGYSPTELEEIMMSEISMSVILDPKVKWDPTLFKYKGHKIGISSLISLFKNKGIYKGEAFQDLMSKLIVSKLEDNLKKEILRTLGTPTLESLKAGYKGDQDDASYNAKVDAYLSQELQVLLQKHNISSLENITFGQLQALDRVYPGLNLKEIYLTGTKLSDGTMKELSHRAVPDMPLLKGLSITMAKPFAMQPQTYDGETYVSGDTSSLYPIDIFDHPDFLSHGLNEAHVNPCTVGLLVDSEDDIKARWGIMDEQHRDLDIAKFASRVIAGMLNRSEQLHDTYQINSVQIPNVRHNPTYFYATDEEKKALLHEGEKALDQYFDLYWGPEVVFEKQKSFKNLMHKYYGMHEQQLIRAHELELVPLIVEARSLLRKFPKDDGYVVKSDFSQISKATFLKADDLNHKILAQQSKIDEKIALLLQCSDGIEQMAMALQSIEDAFVDQGLSEWPPELLERKEKYLLKKSQLHSYVAKINEALVVEHEKLAKLEEEYQPLKAIISPQDLSDFCDDMQHEQGQELRVALEERLRELYLEERIIFKSLKMQHSEYEGELTPDNEMVEVVQEPLRAPMRAVTMLRDSHIMHHNLEHQDELASKVAEHTKKRPPMNLNG